MNLSAVQQVGIQCLSCQALQTGGRGGVGHMATSALDQDPPAPKVLEVLKNHSWPISGHGQVATNPSPPPTGPGHPRPPQWGWASSACSSQIGETVAAYQCRTAACNTLCVQGWSLRRAHRGGASDLGMQSESLTMRWKTLQFCKTKVRIPKALVTLVISGGPNGRKAVGEPCSEKVQVGWGLGLATPVQVCPACRIAEADMTLSPKWIFEDPRKKCNNSGTKN